MPGLFTSIAVAICIVVVAYCFFGESRPVPMKYVYDEDGVPQATAPPENAELVENGNA